MIMPAATTSFELKNSLSELDTLCQNVKCFGKSHALSDKIIFQMNLVLEELLTNIISYGYADNVEHWINISISLEKGALTIQVEDDGIPFNPLSVEKPDLGSPLGERKIGCLGTHLVRELMSDLVYERRGNKNILCMKKNM